MAEVRFDIFTNADSAADVHGRAIERIVRNSERAERALQSLARAFDQPGGAGSASARAQAAQQQVAAIDRVTQARQREAQTERQLAADRARMIREQSRADAERLRAQERANRALLTAQSTLGGAERASAQYLRFQERIKLALDAGIISQQRYNDLLRQGQAAFTTANINAKDLRLNMAGLRESVALLTTSFGRFGPIAISAFSGIQRAIANAKEEIALFVANSNLPPGAGGGGSAFPGGSFGAGAAGGAAARSPGLGVRALALLGGPAGIGALVTGGGAVAGVVQLTRASDDLEVAFDDVAAITGIVGDELDRLYDSAIQLASGSQLGSDATIQLAEGFKLIVAAAPDLARSEESLTEMARAALLLSEASGDPLRNSVETLTTSLLQFNLGAEDSQRVIDALAAGANAGAVEIPGLGEVLANVGAIAAGAGIDIEEMIAVIETAAQSRLPLETIRTSLRNILLELQKTGDIRRGGGLIGAFRAIRDEGIPAFELFEKRSVTVAQVLTNNVETMEELNKATRISGEALRQSAERTDNLTGASNRAASAWGAFRDALANTGPIRAVTDSIQNATDALAEFLRLRTLSITGGDRAGLFADILDPAEIDRRLEEAKAKLGEFRTLGLDPNASSPTQPQLDALIADLVRARTLQSAPIQGPATDPGFGPASTVALNNARERLGELSREYDKGAAALAIYNDAQRDLAPLLEKGGEEAARAAAVLEIVRKATIGRTDASKDEARALREAEQAQAKWEETVRKAALAQQEAEVRAEARIVSIEQENERLARQIDIMGQGAEAVAALNAEYRIQEELLRLQKEKGGPLSLEDVERVREAVRENERLRAVLGEIKKESDTLADRLEDRFEHLGDNIHDALAGSIRGALDESEGFFEDFFDRILSLGKDVFAQLAAAAILQPGATASVLGGLFGGILGNTPLTPIPSSEDSTSQRIVKDQLAETQDQTGLLQSILGILGSASSGFGGILSGAVGGLGSLISGVSGIGQPPLQGPVTQGGVGPLNNVGAIGSLVGALTGIASALAGTGVGAIAAAALIAAALGTKFVTTATTGDQNNRRKGIIQTGSLLNAIFLGPTFGILAGLGLKDILSPARSGVGKFITSPDPNDPRFSIYNNAPLSAESPFGFVGLDASVKQALPDNAQLVGTIAKFDLAFSALLSRRQVEIVSQVLQDTEAITISAEHSFSANDIGRVLADRVRIIQEALLAETDLPIGPPGTIVGFGNPLEITNTNPEAVFEQFEEFTQKLRALEEGFAFLRGDDVTQSAQAIAELEKAFQNLAPIASQFGIELSALEDALDQGLAKLRQGFLDDFAQRILAIEDPLAAALNALNEQREQALREAEALGVETVLLERFFALERLRIIEEFSERANSAIRTLLDQLTGSTASPLPTQSALVNAEARFAEALAGAQAGDLGARDDLAQAARDVLDLRESLFGATQAFFTGPFGFFEIRDALQAVLDTLPTGLSTGSTSTGVGDLFGGTGGSGGEATVVQGVVEIPGVSTAAKQDELRDEIEDLRTVVSEQAADIKGLRTEISRLVSLLERQSAAA